MEFLLINYCCKKQIYPSAFKLKEFMQNSPFPKLLKNAGFYVKFSGNVSSYSHPERSEGSRRSAP